MEWHSLHTDERTLITAAQAGNQAAFSEIYQCYQPVVRNYVFYRVRDDTLADDLTAEVFVRLVDKIDTFVYQERPLLAWLYTIAGNLIKDHYKRNGRMTKLPLLDDAISDMPGPGQLTDQFLAQDILLAAMAELNEIQYQVIIFKFVENRSNPEVARLLGKTEGAIKSIQHRALTVMQGYLERRGKGAKTHEYD